MAASAIIVGAALPARAELFDNLEFSGIFETHTALAFKGTELQTSQFSLTPELSFDISPTMRFTLIGRLRGDLKDRLEPGAPSNFSRTTFNDRLFLGDQLDAEIREAYIDTEIGSSYLRLGKQQIVWGQADGLKVLDILNPQSFREFILPEFEDSRIPLWSVNAEIPIGELTLQLVWIPDTTYDDIPDQGSTFAFTSPLMVPQAPVGVPITFARTNKPSKVISDSDVGVKLSAFLDGWDLSLNYAYHYFDRPVVRRFITGEGVAIHQDYMRSHLIGGTFSNVFGDFTLRGELGYATNRYFQTDDIGDLDGVVRSNDFSYVLGLDYSGITDWFLSAQVFQSFLSNHEPDMIRGSVDTSITFLARRNFMNEALTAEALLIQSLSDGDGLLQLAVTYEWKSNVRLKAGADIFYGKKRGLFGQFREADRLTAGIEVAF
ncbi:DUF1302 family protein [Kordiimonas lacus]|nr:DUF1302 family protein [Kordiimonas lacus]